MVAHEPMSPYRVTLASGVFTVQARSVQAAILRAQADALDGGVLEGILAPLEVTGPKECVARDPGARRGSGRPPLAPEDRAHNKISKLTLDGPIPKYIGYTDLKALIREYRGRMYDEREFKLKVELGIVPSIIEEGMKTAVAGVRRRKYIWVEVRAWIDSTMKPVLPVLTLRAPVMSRR